MILSFIIQAVISLGVSAGVLLVIEPTIYFMIGAISMIVIGGLVASVRSKTHPGEDMSLRWVLYTIGLAIVMGLFWPVLPITAAWGHVREGDANRRAPSHER